jgi:hypothetical protein
LRGINSAIEYPTTTIGVLSLTFK